MSNQHVDAFSIDGYAECSAIMGIWVCWRVYNLNGLQGLKLELCTGDKIGLLSEVTRIFRENSLTVTRAEITTRGGKAVNTFYVRDAAGYPVDSKIISAIRQAIGQTILQVKDHYKCPKSPPQESPPRFLFGSLFKSRPFYNFGFG